MNKEGEAAVLAAESAVELAMQIGGAEAAGSSFLVLAEAHLSLENGEKAQQAAEEARAIFEQMENQACLAVAAEMVEASKKIVMERKTCALGDNAPTTSSNDN